MIHTLAIIYLVLFAISFCLGIERELVRKKSKGVIEALVDVAAFGVLLAIIILVLV